MENKIYMDFAYNKNRDYIEVTCNGLFERVLHICDGWQDARALIRDYVRFADGAEVVCRFPGYKKSNRYVRRSTSQTGRKTDEEPGQYQTKKFLATFNNKYGLNWKILRSEINRMVGNKDGYITVKSFEVMGDEIANIYFEELEK